MVKFDNANQPQQGNYRDLCSCAPGSNFDRSATEDELKPITYYWTMRTDEYGKEWMVIRFIPDIPKAGSYFKATTW